MVERPHPVGAAITHRLGLSWYYRGMIIEGLRWLRLATQSPAATSFERWMAHLSMAGQLCMQTRLDLATPYFAVALDDPPELTDGEVVYAGEIFAVSCQAAWNAGGSSIVTSLAARVRGWADQQDDPALRMFATTTGLMDATADTAPDALLGRIAEAYAQTVALSNRFAAVSHAATGVGVALAARRQRAPGGRGGRLVDRRRAGAGPVGRNTAVAGGDQRNGLRVRPLLNWDPGTRGRSRTSVAKLARSPLRIGCRPL